MNIIEELKGVFQKAVKDEPSAVYEEPLLLSKKADGTRIVHEKTGFFSGMDAVSYSAEKFQEKYGRQTLRTLEEYRAGMKEIAATRTEILQNAEKIYSDAVEYKLAERWDIEPPSSGSPNYLSVMQSRLASIESGNVTREVYEKIERLRTDSAKLGEIQDAMGMRLQRVGSDVQSHGFKLDAPAPQ